jgi:HEAT repeat protein
MRDRSQAAFQLVAEDQSAFGYKVAEMKDGEAGSDPLERVAAILALTRIGTPWVALPDLLLAIDDREPLVANHAAKALVKFGNRSGIPVLLANLSGKILAAETAAEILHELSDGAVSMNPDSGHAMKLESISKANLWWESVQAKGSTLVDEGRPYQKGMDPEADRRIAFYVDVLGQFQFLYHEQARRVFQRMGTAGLPFLRDGIDNSKQTSNETTRGGIAQVLAHIDAPNSRELLKELLKDPAGPVRLRAALSLGNLRGEDAVAALIPALDDADPSVVVSVLRALGRTRSARALEGIERFDPRGSRDLERAQLLALFEGTKGVRGRDQVLQMLSAPALDDRNQAHEVLVALLAQKLDYDPLKDQEHARAVAEAYRELLEALR